MTNGLIVDRTQRRVVCAAVLVPEPIGSGILLVGARHYDRVMHDQINAMRVKPEFAARGEQGFIDQWGKFMDREEAFVVAEISGQIIKKTGNPDSKELFSEDIY